MAELESPTLGSPAASSAGAEEEQRSCWECSRRRLVCDEGRPTCKRCRDGGIVCPGYANTKPLRWLAPGRVTARIRKKPRKKAGPEPSGSSKGKAKAKAKKAAAEATSPAGSAGSNGSPDPSDAGASEEIGQLSLYEGAGQGAGVDSRPQEYWLKWEVPRLVPQGMYVTNETEIVQATYYYNYHVFPEYSVHQLTPSVFVIPLPLEALKGASPAIIHILVSVAVRHRIYRVASNRRAADKDGLIELRSKYYHHRDKAITALNDEIYSYKNAYMLMISALLFVFAELQQSSAPAWKVHMDAMMGMLSNSGGMTKICHKFRGMCVTMILYTMIHVTGNTTSPPSTLTLKPGEMEDMLEFTSEFWEDIPYPSFMCPLEILHVIIAINHVRARVLEAPLSQISPSPSEILARLQAFSPEVWAAAKTCANEEWLLITRAHHSAAILYLAATLGPHFPADELQGLEVLRAMHASELRDVLREGEPIPAVRMGTLWPLIVAAVEVAKGEVGLRPLVRGRLERLADDLATPLMVEAKEVLERYWASERQGWDECFDRPYAFVL